MTTRDAEKVGIGAFYIKSGEGNSDAGSFAKIEDGRMVTIDTAHHEIHEGEMFYATVEDLDFDTAQVISISFTTPTGVECHMFPSIFMTVAGTFDILEGGTVSDTGTEYAVLNRNRPSTNTSGVTDFTSDLTSDSTTLNGTLGGTPSDFGNEGFTGTKNQQQAQVRSQSEWILKPATAYTFRLISAADDGIGRITLNWYEETT